MATPLSYYLLVFEKMKNSMLSLASKVCVYLIEKCSRRADRVACGQLTCVFDRINMTQSKDKKFFPIYKAMGHILQDYYPERLKIAIVVNANWFTKIVIAMCKVFLAKSTKRKICVVSHISDLQEYIDDKNMPEQYKTNLENN